ncbi:competence protein CoiA family protein [Priestia koreensis]|uniref:competence protein CoiA family protein n=1 Tax=Priestia koreensis TaxID=284581 RepID=UPI003D049335
MPRYAYIPVHNVTNNIPPHLTIDEFQDKKVIKIDSTEISKEEYEWLKKELKESCYCFSCDSKMKFVAPKNKHQHFSHISRRECFAAESLAHASVKRNLYERFKKRGYKVAVERSFQFHNKQLYTDIAVMEKKDILAIEVQASPGIKLSTIAERTSTYAEADIPTAWVVILDSFFGEGKFTSTKENVLVHYDDGTSGYEEKLLPYTAATPFIVTSEIPKSFLFLMEQYKYIIAVNHEGHFFMIRRVKIEGDVFEIYRIEQDKVVDTLLKTDIRTIVYHSEDKHEDPDHELLHNDGSHKEEDELLEGGKLLEEWGIPFDTAYQEEQEQLKTETAIDILQIIEETKKREQLHNKKERLLKAYNQQIIETVEHLKAIKQAFHDLEHKLSVQYTEIEQLNLKRVKEKELDEINEKKQAEIERKKREQADLQLYLEHERTKKERMKKERSESEERAIELNPLLQSIREFFLSHTVDDLKRLKFSYIDLSYYVYDYLESKSLIAIHYSEFRKCLDNDLHQLLNQILIQKDQNPQSIRESTQDQKEKEKLCKSIQEIQLKTNCFIERDIAKLRGKSLKELKKTYKILTGYYHKKAQMTLF